MNYVFRAPKFPLLLDTGSELVHAKTRFQFAKRVAALELRGNRSLEKVVSEVVELLVSSAQAGPR